MIIPDYQVGQYVHLKPFRAAPRMSGASAMRGTSRSQDRWTSPRRSLAGAGMGPRRLSSGYLRTGDSS